MAGLSLHIYTSVSKLNTINHHFLVCAYISTSLTKLIPSLLFLWSQGVSSTSRCVCCQYDACYYSGERMHSMGKWFKCCLFCARWDEMSSTKQHHPVKRLLSFWVSAADCSVQIHLSCNHHLMVESPFICCNITSHASRVASPPCCCYEQRCAFLLLHLKEFWLFVFEVAWRDVSFFWFV